MRKITATHSNQNKGLPKNSVPETKMAVGPSAPPIIPILAERSAVKDSAGTAIITAISRKAAREMKNTVLKRFFIFVPPAPRGLALILYDIFPNLSSLFSFALIFAFFLGNNPAEEGSVAVSVSRVCLFFIISCVFALD